MEIPTLGEQQPYVRIMAQGKKQAFTRSMLINDIITWSLQYQENK